MQKQTFMKNRQVLIVLILVLALVSSSCKDRLFDFDLHNIESDGEWGFPVFNKTLHTNDLLQNLDSMVFFSNDGILTFVFENEVRNVISLQDLFQIEDQIVDTSGIETISHLPDFDIVQVVQFNLNTSDFILKYAEIKSGLLSLTFNIDHVDFNYSAVLTTDNIRNSQGESLSLYFNDAQHTQSINFSNHVIEPDEYGFITFTAHIVVPNSVDIDQIEYSSHVVLTNFIIHSVRGQINTISHQIDDKTAFNLQLNEIQFNNIRFNNGKVSIFSQNDICRVDGSLNEAYLSGSAGAYAPLISHPLPFSIPTSSQYSFVTNTNIPTINYTQNLDSIGLQCDFNINPLGFAAGDISVDENSALHLKFKTELPANMSIDNAVYHDTLDNALYHQFDLSDQQSMEELTLRLALTHAFPFDLIPEIYFLESNTGNKYKLDLNDARIYGSYNGIPRQQPPIFVELHHDNALRIINADKIILNFKLNTQGQDVEVRDSQYIHISLGAKIKYSNINASNLVNPKN